MGNYLSALVPSQLADCELNILVVGNYTMFSKYLTHLAEKTYDLDGTTVKAMIIYAEREQGLQTLSSSYYNGFHGIIISYDLTDLASFDDSKRWLEKINRYACRHICKLLVGAKGSMSDRVVEYNTGKMYADKLEIPFAEIPEIVAEKIHLVFEKMVDDAFWNLRRKQREQRERRTSEDTETDKSTTSS